MTISYSRNVCVLISIAIIISSEAFEFPDRSGKVCGLDQFRCANGDCISSELLCDGKGNCLDGSDETREECLKPEIICPDYAFRCGYGACVDGDATCNGINDCADSSDEMLPSCRDSSTVNPLRIPATCVDSQFRCENGQCIDDTSLCDGSPDCSDRSDETSIVCNAYQCPPLSFRCTYGACIDGDLKCNGIRNCADGSDEEYIICGSRPTINQPRITTERPTSRPSSPRTVTSPYWTQRPLCSPPEQPRNGRWQLEKSQCQSNEHCDAPEDAVMVPGTHLVYSCNPRYQVKGPSDVFCGSKGKWSSESECVEIRCKALSSASTTAECTYEDEWKSCEIPVPPGTIAKVSCRNSYRQDMAVLGLQRDTVRCNSNGVWEPEPIRCVPGPLIINIHVNGTTLSLENNGKDSNCNLLKIVEILKDKIIVYTDVQTNDNPQIDVRIS